LEEKKMSPAALSISASFRWAKMSIEENDEPICPEPAVAIM